MIVCFSGTGNSFAVAGKLAELAKDSVCCLGEPMVALTPIEPGENVVWVMPCHSWGMPKWVRKRMATLEMPGAKDACHHLVMTCGDDIGLAHMQWRKMMAKRGWKTVGTYSVTMPNTYVLLPGFNVDPPLLARQKIDMMPQRTARIWHGIKCGARVDDVTRGHCAWLKTRIVYPLFMRFLTSPKPFHATRRCIGCGKCAKVCPLKNITMQDKRPAWGSRCTLCLGCYHICPVHAAAYGNITANKGQKQTQEMVNL